MTMKKYNNPDKILLTKKNGIINDSGIGFLLYLYLDLPFSHMPKTVYSA